METLSSDQFKYVFEKHPKKKGDCPQCNTNGVFRYYEGLSKEYGKCDRENNCGYHNKPIGLINNYAPPMLKPEHKVIYPSEQLCENLIKNQTSLFHTACIEKLNIPEEYFRKWNIGSNEKNETAFIFQNKNKKFLNVKFIDYDARCKRNKEKFLYYLSSRHSNEKYSLCLFGEHLLSNKIVCLVESEKTAFTASSLYPQFDWLATGSSNGLTNEKISVLKNCEVYYLPDADKAGRDNSSINALQFHKINFKIIDLFPQRNDGYDLADALFEGLKPEIKPSDKTPEPMQVKQVAGAKDSLFQKVEKIINDEYDLRYNEVSNEIECKPKGMDEVYKAMNENNLFRFLQHNNVKISLSNLGALLRSDFVSVFNPIILYFESLENWDEKSEPDYIDKVSEYVKAKEVDRFKIHFKKAIVRTLACALNDNYFNKHCFVLVQDMQNSGKTTFIRWLCPPTLSNYIAENISTDKDSRIALCENFIINLDELATMNKTDMNSLKSLFSKDKIKDRPPFGKKSIVFPRRASFFGSTDRTEFLTDEAGSVRWLCFQLTEKINWNYKNDIDINNIWREAYALYKSGFKYDLTAEEIKENENVNKSFRVSNPEIELILKTFEQGTKEKNDMFYTASEVLNYFAEKYPNIRLNHVSIGKALKTLGFIQEQTRKIEIDYPVKGYYLNFRKNED